MSQGRYAPITANLLVRKGEASPSPMNPSPAEAAAPSSPPPSSPPPSAPAYSVQPNEPQPQRVTWLSELQARRKPADSPEPRFVYTAEPRPPGSGHGGEAKPPDNEKHRRIVLNLTAHEYETLGLVAVKKGTTRHHLAQAAMDAYFEWLVAEYGEACNCIVGGALCRCECPH